MLKKAVVGVALVLCLLAAPVVLRFYWPRLPVVDYHAKRLALIESAQLDPSAPDAYALIESLHGRIAQADQHMRDRLREFLEAEGEAFSQYEHESISTLAEAARRSDDSKVLEFAEREWNDFERSGFFIECNQLPRHLRIDFLDPPGALLEHHDPVVGKSRGISRFLLLHLRGAFANGDAVTAARSLEQILILSKLMAVEPSLIGGLVSGSIAAAGVKEVQNALNSRTFDRNLWQALHDTLNQHASAPSYVRALEGERLQLHDVIQLIYRKSVFDMTLGQARWVLQSTHANTTRDVDLFFDRLIAAAQSSPTSGRLNTSVFEMEATQLARKHRSLGVLLPAISTAHAVFISGETLIGGTRLAIAIELHRADHGGALPRTLNELVPRYFNRLPTDSLASDGRFGYVPATSTSSEPPTGAILYSVGFDAIDNGGIERPAEVRERILSKDTHAGNDFVFWPPDRIPQPLPRESEDDRE